MARNVPVNFDSDDVNHSLRELVCFYEMYACPKEGGPPRTMLSYVFERAAIEEGKDRLLEIARLLLDAGADMSTGFFLEMAY